MLLKLVKDLFKSGFSRSVMIITGGTVFAQVLNILLFPVITRIYSPEEFGILIVYTALLGIISLLGALSYDSAIPISDDDEKATNILLFCIMLLFLATAVFIVFLYLLGDFILELFDACQLMQYKYFIPIGFFATGLYTIFTKWAFRKKDFNTIAKTKYSQSVVGNAMKIGLGLLSIGPIGLVFGSILGQSAGVGTLVRQFFKNDKELLKSFSMNEVVWAAKRYVKFPLYSAPSLFLISFSSQVHVIFISSLYGPRVVGFYGLAKSITFLPMTIIGQSIQDVFYGETASIGRDDPKRVKDLSNKLLKKLILLGIIPLVALVVLGPLLFSLVFGQSWNEAGVYSRLLALFVFSHFIFHPISTVFSIFEQQKVYFILNVIKLVLVLLTFGLAKVLAFNSYITVLIFSAAMAIVELFKYILAQKVINHEIEKKRRYT